MCLNREVENGSLLPAQATGGPHSGSQTLKFPCPFLPLLLVSKAFHSNFACFVKKKKKTHTKQNINIVLPADHGGVLLREEKESWPKAEFLQYLPWHPPCFPVLSGYQMVWKVQTVLATASDG